MPGSLLVILNLMLAVERCTFPETFVNDVYVRCFALNL